MVLDIRFDARMGFRNAAELRFPIAVEDHPIDVASARIRFVTAGPGGIKIHLFRRADRIIRIEHGLDRTTTDFRACDGGRDAFTGHICKFLVHQLRRICASLAGKAGIEPLPGNALELSEKMKLRFLARVPPFGIQQPLGEVEQKRGLTNVIRMNQIEVHAFADNPLVCRDGWSDYIRCQFQNRVLVELGVKPFLR